MPNTLHHRKKHTKTHDSNVDQFTDEQSNDENFMQVLKYTLRFMVGCAVLYLCFKFAFEVNRITGHSDCFNMCGKHKTLSSTNACKNYCDMDYNITYSHDNFDKYIKSLMDHNRLCENIDKNNMYIQIHRINQVFNGTIVGFNDVYLIFNGTNTTNHFLTDKEDGRYYYDFPLVNSTEHMNFEYHVNITDMNYSYYDAMAYCELNN